MERLLEQILKEEQAQTALLTKILADNGTMVSLLTKIDVDLLAALAVDQKILADVEKILNDIAPEIVGITLQPGKPTTH